MKRADWLVLLVLMLFVWFTIGYHSRSAWVGFRDTLQACELEQKLDRQRTLDQMKNL